MYRRMKQLEQRVEMLVGLLASTGATPTSLEALESSTSTRGTTSTGQLQSSPSRDEFDDDSSEASIPTFTAYDAVDAGLLDEVEAVMLLNEFRQHCPSHFPFVVLEDSADADTIRREQPFLFLAIMTAMAYRTPTIQRALADAFKDQVAIRVVGFSHKGLEILQGLLIHSAYYQYYYRPGQQQLALMIQMSVAMAQELGLTKVCKVPDSTPVLSRVEHRALLGAFYLAAAFAQAWRKRTTVPYTRTIARICQMFSQNPEHPSDLLIMPLVQSSELAMRISDYYSFEDIDETEIRGETLLKLSTSNFSAELQKLRIGIPESVQTNSTIRLACNMLDVMVHECSVHSTLWRLSPSDTSAPMSHVRYSMLQRCLRASQTFARTLLGTSSQAMNYLTFPTWSGWFFSTLIVMKVGVLRQVGVTGSKIVSNVPGTVGELLPQEPDGSTTQRVCRMTASLAHSTLEGDKTTSEEVELILLFTSLIQKLTDAAPAVESASNDPAIKHYLLKVARLQELLLQGIRKLNSPDPAQCPCTPSCNSECSAAHQFKPLAQSTALEQSPHGEQSQSGPIEYGQLPNYGFVDNAVNPGLPSDQVPLLDDWLWDIVINDGNMFTLGETST
ncbi:hypothetical protein DE146DRAFT_751139 [Phaeosphaeria sp. MPI-PUGE-AT-0046c]|nr:hypothetical protein DE146DRAFT_751139 [Phaeosphaeria sp. MPI-PUGE-AT-0046c]